jgi:hypothetical protein
VLVNLAHRRFRKLGIEDAVLDHSAFSRAGTSVSVKELFFRRLLERAVEAYMLRTWWGRRLCGRCEPDPGRCQQAADSLATSPPLTHPGATKPFSVAGEAALKQKRPTLVRRQTMEFDHDDPTLTAIYCRFLNPAFQA